MNILPSILRAKLHMSLSINPITNQKDESCVDSLMIFHYKRNSQLKSSKKAPLVNTASFFDKNLKHDTALNKINRTYQVLRIISQSMFTPSTSQSFLKDLHKLLDKIDEVEDYDTRNSPEWLPFIVRTKYYRFLQKHQCWKYSFDDIPCSREEILDEIRKFKGINFMMVGDQVVSSWWFGRNDGPGKDASTAFWNAMTDLEHVLQATDVAVVPNAPSRFQTAAMV